MWVSLIRRVATRNSTKLQFTICCQHGNRLSNGVRYFSSKAGEKAKPNAESSSSQKPPKEGYIFRLLDPLFRQTYILDTRATVASVLLGAAYSIGAVVWWFSKGDGSVDDWRSKHFACSLRNIEEGRYYTVLTSAFGGTLCRTVGSLKLFGVFLGSHILTTTTVLAASNYHYNNVVSLQNSWKSTGNYDAALSRTSFIGEKRKLIAGLEVLEGIPFGDTERRKKFRAKLMGLPDEEILQMAIDRYRNRAVPSTAGALAILALVAKINPKSLLPIPRFPLPFLPMVAIFFAAQMSAFREYHPGELVGVLLTPPFLFTLVVGTGMSRSQGFAREMPMKYLQLLKLDHWASAARQQPPPPPPPQVNSKVLGVQLTDIPSPQAIMAMRKRNQRIQQRTKSGSNQQQSVGK